MRRVILCWLFVLPLPVAGVMFCLWLAITDSWLFTAYAVGVPLAYGYVMPGIATNVLKKWRFNGPLRMGNYFAHHGLVYAANWNTVLMVLFQAFRPSGFGWGQFAAMIFCCGAAHGFVLWIFDTLLAKHGLVTLATINAPSAEAATFAYAPAAAFLSGMIYGGGALLLHRCLLSGELTFSAAWKVAAAVFLLLLLLPPLVYRMAERRHLKS